VLVEFRELKWALIATQHRSLRRAAETLNIRQSMLGRRLRDLELQLGAVLFERTNGGTKPPAAGQEFCASARNFGSDSLLMKFWILPGGVLGESPSCSPSTLRSSRPQIAIVRESTSKAHIPWLLMTGPKYSACSPVNRNICICLTGK
jgi:hypothetical protein